MKNIIKKQTSKIILFIAGLFILASCGKENKIPMGYVNFTIEPNSSMYSNLNNVGGYEYFIGGYKGVLVFRTGINDFVAFERACPFDHEVAVEVNKNNSNIIECPQCGSQFIYIYGDIIKGPATTHLRQYNTSYNGTYLHIFN